MKRLIAYGAVLLLCASALAQNAKVHWSLGYYCGWDQDAGMAPSKVDWKAFTHVSHFTLFPKADGSIDGSNNGLTDANCNAAVTEAHKNGVKIVICIGGSGVKDAFKGACSPANIHKFVKNLLDFMRKYGYDGIDTDWEENYDDVEFVAWHKELRDSINNIPGKTLTIAGAGYFAAHCAIAAPYVDFLNTMSYDVKLSGMASEMKEFTSRGFPKEKLGVGIGIGSGGGMVDADSATAKGKVLFAINNGFGGVMQWAVQGTARHVSIFKMLEQYIPAGGYTLARNDARLRILPAASLSVSLDAMGVPEIRYAVASGPSRAGLLDVSLYDLRGNLVRNLRHGPTQAGTFAIPLDQGSAGQGLNAGRYLVKLTTDSRSETALASILR